MSAKSLFRTLLMFLFTIGFISCGDDDKPEYHLELSENSCEVVQGNSIVIDLIAHENTTLVIEKTELIDAVFTWGFDGYKAKIEIKGKQKGETYIVVTDHETQELAMLKVKVTESNSTSTLNLVPGVVKFDMTAMKILVDSKAGVISAKEFEKYSENDCLVVNFSYDSQNQVSDKYTTVTLTSEPTKIDKGLVRPVMTDTATLKKDEVALLSSVETNSPYNAILAYLNGYLFLPSGISMPEKQQTNWELSYDLQTAAVEESGKRIYSLFLRATISVPDEKGEAKNTLIPNAYYMKNYFDAVNAIEKGKGTEAYYVKVYYVNKINEKDRKEFTWAACEPIEFAVTKEK